MTKHMQNKPEWVSSREGATLLGVKQPNFLYYAKNGEIATDPNSPPKRRLYKRSDIVKVKERLQAKRYKPSPVVFDVIRREDLPACLRLDQIVSPEEIDMGELGTSQSWRGKNQHISIAAYDASNRDSMLAYITFVPLAEPIILDILRGVRADQSVTAEEVETYDRPGPYILLALRAVCHPDRPELLRKLLNHVTASWVDRFPERYITRIYARAMTPTENVLVQHFFMAPRYDVALDAYMLDLARPSASHIIRRFQESLQKKGEALGVPYPEELTRPYIPPAFAPAPTQE